jgi:hypothetical protein
MERDPFEDYALEVAHAHTDPADIERECAKRGIVCWSEEQKLAMHAAFERKAGMKAPRTEALFAVAMIGYRAAIERGEHMKEEG